MCSVDPMLLILILASIYPSLLLPTGIVYAFLSTISIHLEHLYVLISNREWLKLF